MVYAKASTILNSTGSETLCPLRLQDDKDALARVSVVSCSGVIYDVGGQAMISRSTPVWVFSKGCCGNPSPSCRNYSPVQKHSKRNQKNFKKANHLMLFCIGRDGASRWLQGC